jgi:hypothetical protein
MASEAQIEANRRNAERSTGPRTREGKAAASRNALKHGLTARQVVIFDESRDDFARFHDEMREVLAPADAVEEQLVERIILCSWRLRRVSRAEAALFEAGARKRQGWGRPERVHAGLVFEAPQEIGALTRYEAAIERALHRAYALLERRRMRAAAAGDHENCKTKPISPPAAVADAAAEAGQGGADGVPDDGGRGPASAIVDAGRAWSPAGPVAPEPPARMVEPAPPLGESRPTSRAVIEWQHRRHQPEDALDREGLL